MKIFLSLVIIFTTTFMFLKPIPLESAILETAKVNDAIEVLEGIMAIPERGIPPALLSNSYGIAIIPGLIKVGLIVGGRHGRGIMVVRDKEGKWSNPSFVTLTGGSIGWQIGAQSADIILVFKSQKSIEGIKRGKFTFGVDASIAAGPVGRHIEAETDVELNAEIYSYSRTRGLFAGVSLEGAALQIDNDVNAAFYGRRDIRANDIFGNETIKAPPEVNRLKKVLTKYTFEKLKN
jgi:lipid-binding SYLF domain-containing protein